MIVFRLLPSSFRLLPFVFYLLANLKDFVKYLFKQHQKPDFCKKPGLYGNIVDKFEIPPLNYIQGAVFFLQSFTSQSLSTLSPVKTMDTSKVESVKESIRVLPNTLMQMPSMGIVVDVSSQLMAKFSQTIPKQRLKINSRSESI
ncbi:hypothetical protein [Nostoc sp. GT001]|uniref:hypothetical protein n=2 Tax=unclassified Nostoc TaxID=2593658 RepID=UPI0025AB0A4F|nr:hypothetical protein [Nostoc sp. GT001]MDM9582952.1 hypothetical protein [Nostoc sp. GT001]